MVIPRGRQERCMLLEDYNNRISSILRFMPPLLLLTLLSEFSDTEWKDNFRMTRGSFERLCGLMEEVLSPQEVTVHTPIPLKMRVVIVLYKLASCAEYRVVGNQLGVHKSTVKKFVYSFCKRMVSSVINLSSKCWTSKKLAPSHTDFSRNSAWDASTEHTSPFCHQVMDIRTL